MKKIAQPHQRVPELVAGRAQARPRLRPVIEVRKKPLSGAVRFAGQYEKVRKAS
jgi:hypothetical protein